MKTRATMTVPEAGRQLGVGRNLAYEAAHRGQIPTIRIGKRMLVPVVAFERLLRGEHASLTTPEVPDDAAMA